MLNRFEETKMAVVMDAEFMGGDYFVPCNTVGPGSKNLASSLRYSLKRKAAAALAPCGIEGGSDWQLDPISDLSVTSPQGSAGVWQERTWRALEPTVIGNRVQWTCNVAPTPRSSDMMSSTLHCSDPSDDSAERRGSGLQDNMSDHSFTSTLTNDTDRESASVLMPVDLDFKFPAATEIQLQDVRSLLDVVVPGSLPSISDDGYSDFELLSSQFPMISTNFEANEDSNSCGSGSGSSENHTWSSAAAENLCCSVDEIIPGCMKFEPEVEVEVETLQQQDVEQLEIMGDHGPCGISRMLFAEQQQEDSKHFLGEKQRHPISKSDDANGMLAGAVSVEDEEALGIRYKEECGVELVQKLLACARAIEDGELLAGRRHVARLRQLMSPKGSPMERVATYFTEALAAWLGDGDHADEDVEQQRGIVRGMGRGKFGNAVDDGEYMEFSELEQTCIAYQVFYASCPYLIVTHFTANQAILEAFEGEEKVHVVDLDIKQGLQWPSLIQALSLRAGGPPQLRITGVAGAAPDLPSMMATRNRLLDFADMFSVPLEFTILTENVESLQPWMLGIRDHEALAVNCVSSLHQLIDHPRRPLRDFLLMIHSLEPSVVTVVEQDSNHDQDFFPRFMVALHYFSSMFDSLAASVSSSLVEREMVERLLLGKEIMNIVGQHRGRSFNGRHQTANVWMQHMSEVGFQCCPLTPHSTLQAKFLLNMYPLSKYCLLVKDDGYLTLGWQDNPLYCVTCWC